MRYSDGFFGSKKNSCGYEEIVVWREEMAEAWRELIELPLCVTFLAAAWQDSGLRSSMKLTSIEGDSARRL